MATHSSVLAWRIPGMEEPVGCRLWGRTGSDTPEATQQRQQKHKGIHRTGGGAGRHAERGSLSAAKKKGSTRTCLDGFYSVT